MSLQGRLGTGQAHAGALAKTGTLTQMSHETSFFV